MVGPAAGATTPGRDTTIGGVPGRAWTPPDSRGSPILLAAGVTPAGPADARVVRVARALAGAGRTVFVPRLLLADHELAYEDVDRLVRAAEALSRAPRDVTIVGFSFGGSYALVAAADRRVADRVRLVATFGAYADLIGVLRAATTGMSLYRGRRWTWTPGIERFGAGSGAILDTDFARILLREVARLSPDTEVSGLERALRGDSSVSALAPQAAAACRLLANRRPERVGALARQLPDGLADLLERLSPLSVAQQVSCPVVLMHAVNDPTVPFVEMRRLERAFPEAPAHAVRLFTHVDFAPTPRDLLQAARDIAHVWRFTATALS